MTEPDDTTQDEAAQEDTGADGGADAGVDIDAPDPRSRLLIACWALVVVTALFAGVSGWWWWSTAHDESLARAEARDEALSAARQHITSLHTVDHDNVDAGLRRWLGATTGPLHDQLRRTRADSKQRLEQAETSTEGTVTSAAITAVDQEAGTARAIATVTVRVTSGDDEASTERNRYRVTLNRTETGWKLSSLTAIPVEPS